MTIFHPAEENVTVRRFLESQLRTYALYESNRKKGGSRFWWLLKCGALDLHWQAHQVLEAFGEPYRAGQALEGEFPTLQQYSRAALRSLRAAGLNTIRSSLAVRRGLRQFYDLGYFPWDEVPNIPERINMAR